MWTPPGLQRGFEGRFTGQGSTLTSGLLMQAGKSTGRYQQHLAQPAPASCQSRSRRQQLMPELHPISRGNIGYRLSYMSCRIFMQDQ